MNVCCFLMNKLFCFLMIFTNFLILSWKNEKQKKRDKKSKNVFINSAILLFLFKPLPLFFMLLNSQKHYWTQEPSFYPLFNGLTVKGNKPKTSGKIDIKPSNLFFQFCRRKQNKMEAKPYLIWVFISTKVQQFFPGKTQNLKFSLNLWDIKHKKQ